MKNLKIELLKEKRTGIMTVLLAVGILGAAYILVNYLVRKEALLSLPLPPMDILLTQLYGMVMILNLFGIVITTSMIYNMEFKGNAIKKMYMLPIHLSHIYQYKFLILTVLLLITVLIENLALLKIGIMDFPSGTFETNMWLHFTLYSFLTSMPVLSFMLLVSSQSENLWIPLGIGVTGFLSGMALASSDVPLLLIDPFIVMLKPAVAMSANPDLLVEIVSILETISLFCIGIYLAKTKKYE